MAEARNNADVRSCSNADKLARNSNTLDNRASRVSAILAAALDIHMAVEVTWDNADWIYGGSGWNGSQISLDFNYGPGGTYAGQGFPDIDTGNPSATGHWDNTNYPGVHTRTIMWDYSAYLPAIQALYDSGQLTDAAGWLEFNFNTNAGSYAYPVAYYFDNFRFTTPATATPGDFDEDGDVDGRDFLEWQRGNSPTPLSATDLANWQANYGGSPLAAVSATPDPAGLALVSLGSMVALFARKRHS